MLAHAALALSLVVRVYDAYGVSPATLGKARAAAARILNGADLRIAWETCPCTDKVGPAELVIRISAAPPQIDAASLGFSFIDVYAKPALATVLPTSQSDGAQCRRR